MIIIIIIIIDDQCAYDILKKKITILYVDIIRNDTKKERLSNRLQKKADGEKVLKG